MKIKSNDYQPLILFGLFWAFSITVLRALRWPNDYSTAHWLISYNFGFIKRGLPGTLIAPLTNPNNITTDTELVLKIVSTFFFLIFCSALLWICFRIIQKSQFDINLVLVVLVFFTSPYIVMSAHLNGYYDNIDIIISVFACWLIMRKNIWLSATILSIGVLIHETIFLVGFPSVLFLALIQHTKEIEVSSPRQLFLGFLSRYKVLVFLPLLSFSFIIIYQTVFLDVTIINNQLIAYLSQFDFIQGNRPIVVSESFTTSAFEYLKIFGPNCYSRITSKPYVFHIGLPLFVLLNYSWQSLRRVVFNKLIFLTVVVLTLLPLFLHLIACDVSRIWTYPLIVAMLAVWGIGEIFPNINNRESKKRESFPFCIIAIIIILFQFFSLTPLMDGAGERYSNEKRILLYAPTVIAILVSKYCCFSKRSI